MTKTFLTDGDILSIPASDGRVGVAQVLGTYKRNAWLVGVYFVAATNAEAIRAIKESQVFGGDPLLLALTFDAKVAAGDWTVIGHDQVAPNAPRPAFIEMTAPPDVYDVVDFSGDVRRRATPADVKALPARKIVAPVRLEKALNARLGLIPWVTAYDDLVPR